MHLVAPLIHSHFKLFDAQFHRLYFPPRSASVAFYLDGPGHLLTVILAPGGADTDCQRDVSFLLFISSLPERDAAERKSAFSPRRVRAVGGREGVGENSGGWRDGGVARPATLGGHVWFLAIGSSTSLAFFTHSFPISFAPTQPRTRRMAVYACGVCPNRPSPYL